MEILLKRLAIYKQCLHGRLYIEGDHVCDTLERVGDCLAPGRYRISRMKMKLKKKGRERRYCPSFFAENGPYALPCGGVAIGEWKYLGFLIHCAESYQPLMDRLRMATNRGNDVMLEIVDAVELKI